MICKYCGGQLSGSMCTSCKKMVSLSYTSHELADLQRNVISNKPRPNNDQYQSDHAIETVIQLNANNEQLQAAYNSGFEAGQKHGFTTGFDSAQKEFTHTIRKRQRFFLILASGCAITLVLLSAIVTGSIRYSSGYQDGVKAGRQEQKKADEILVPGAYEQEYNTGHDDGFHTGYTQGISVTPTPTPLPAFGPPPVFSTFQKQSRETKTPPNTSAALTSEPLLLQKGSKGDVVRCLQQCLIRLDYLSQNGADGDFGPKTEKAVQEYQKSKNIEPTGIVDKELLDRILSDAASASSSMLNAPETEN